MKSVTLLAVVKLITIVNGLSDSTTLPTVDLGYSIHRALSFNETGRFYNFSNIRYAAAPVGELRFTPPQPPPLNRSSVDTGSVGRICAQANANWLATSAEFLPTYLTDEPYNVSTIPSAAANASLPYNERDPRITEDCLFLDVVVPKTVFDSTGVGHGAPVFVWIHGGGYIGGAKGDGYNPSGLLARPTKGSSVGIVFVTINYRLGALGWLAGPSLQSNGSANAGLLDQEMALEWVQKNIHLFGGDKKRVTVGGESSGAGSVMHQVTAYGGFKGTRPFQQALIQSPGWLPLATSYESEKSYESFLQLLGANSLSEVRQLPADKIFAASIQLVRAATYGQFVWGPVVDGFFAPAHPQQLLARAQFDDSLRLILAHNSNEGLLFTSPLSQSSSTFEKLVRAFVPSISDAEADYVTSTLYPSVYTGSFPYVDPVSRMALFLSEGIFTCNTDSLSRAFNNETYNYRFAVPPGLHGTDTPYTFWNGGASASAQNATIAAVMQDFITSFVESGIPTTSTLNVPVFRQRGKNATLLNLAPTGITYMLDETANERCAWWRKAIWE